MHNGTRQGSVLSPFLFCIYMRDISNAVVNSGLGCHIGNMPTNILLYADDIVILAPSWVAQQKLLNLCSSYVDMLDMTFNVAKCVTLIFTPTKISRRLSCSFANFTLAGSAINTAASCKYLGFLLSVTNNDNDDISNHCKALYIRANVLLRKFGKCNIDVKLCLFKTYCMNLYGAALWHNFNVSVMYKLQAAYVKCVKIFFGYERRYSATEMFLSLGLPTLATVVHNAKFRFSTCVSQHVNPVVAYVHNICSQ